MSDAAPARVAAEVDAVKAPVGRATIQVQSPLSFASPELAAATLAALGGVAATDLDGGAPDSTYPAPPAVDGGTP